MLDIIRRLPSCRAILVAGWPIAKLIGHTHRVAGILIGPIISHRRRIIMPILIKSPSWYGPLSTSKNKIQGRCWSFQMVINGVTEPAKLTVSPMWVDPSMKHFSMQSVGESMLCVLPTSNTSVFPLTHRFATNPEVVIVIMC